MLTSSLCKVNWSRNYVLVVTKKTDRHLEGPLTKVNASLYLKGSNWCGSGI